MRQEMDDRINKMVKRTGLADCKECGVRRLYQIDDLIFSDLGLNRDELLLVFYLGEMIFLTYDCEPNPRDAGYYIILQYLYHKTVNSVLGLDSNRESLQVAEPLRREHFHAWITGRSSIAAAGFPT